MPRNRPDRPRGPRHGGAARRPFRQLPALAVLAVVVAGLLVVAAVDAQTGIIVFGLAVLLAAALRMSLPTRQAGWLVVRTRGLDAAFLLGLGFAVIVLATSIPDL